MDGIPPCVRFLVLSVQIVEWMELEVSPILRTADKFRFNDLCHVSSCGGRMLIDRDYRQGILGRCQDSRTCRLSSLPSRLISSR